jgi:propanediol dehydratase large subunit
LTARDKSLAAVATDSAKAGEVELAKTTLQQMTEFTKRNQTALEAVRLLARRGMRKQALEIATAIDEFTTRDQALSELAQ